MARQALKQKAAEEQLRAYEEQMELSEYTKLALLNEITKQNNDQQSHRLASIARGEGAVATAVREALSLVDMDLTDVFGRHGECWMCTQMEGQMELAASSLCRIWLAGGWHR